MIKRIFYIILLFLLLAVSPAISADFRVSDIKTDYSGNNIVLFGKNSADSVTYKAGFAQNPLRAYIDLENSVFAQTKANLTFDSQPIKKVAIAQFSTNPNKVRLVFYSDNENALKRIKLIKNGNILTFKLNDFKNQTNSIPVIFSDILPKQYKETTLSQINDFKFSKYILTKVYETDSGLLLSGVGNVKLSRPFILINPIRIVFDVQNATVYRKALYKEHKLANGDSVKVGQYNADTLRFVVTTDNPASYKSFISPDLQSIYLANISDMKTVALPNARTLATVRSVYLQQPSKNETIITINFTHPVIHSIRRTYNKFLIDFLNVEFSQASAFNTKKTDQFGGFTSQKLSENMEKLSILFPVSDTLKVETGMTLDGKSILIKLTGTLEKPVAPEIKPAVTKADTVSQPKKQTKTILPLSNKVIVVDAGHGGKDSGAISGKMYEKVPALNMALMLQKNLEAKGAKVIMTRKDDTFISLQDRVSISNFENADLFISIHLNSSEKSSINGIETHWYKQNSKVLAEKVQNELIKAVKGANNRGLFNSMFYVINHTTAPAILVETGFISNPTERDALFTTERQKIISKAIADGIVEYYKKETKK